MTDYKYTLNLPQTHFPMKAGLATMEPKRLQDWQARGLYQQIRKTRTGQEKFILHDGPPYANGSIHIGHAVNKVLKDIIIKAKTLSGFDAPYIPGWDCHGLPIELNVEKKHGKPGHKIPAKEFRQHCRDHALRYVNEQRQDFERLGVLGAWDTPYLTMDPRFEAAIVRSLGQIIANGHLHKGYKPVHWCIDCGSALAEAEVEYEEKTSPAIDVAFAVLDEEALWARCHFRPSPQQRGSVAVPIWTTTPWTLPANQAVALHPTTRYVIVRVDSSKWRYLIVAEALVDDVISRYGMTMHQIVAHCTGENLAGLKLQHPFYAREVPTVLGLHVTTDTGTGAVHTAPGHGEDDYHVGMAYHLPIHNPVGDNGCYVAGTPLLENIQVWRANDKIIELLRSQQHLLHAEHIRHSYPHCWRHKTPIIFRATPQWFISMTQKKLREHALAAMDTVHFIPAWGAKRMQAMISERPDWCISRQRTWGVPLPLFVHKQSGELHPETQKLLEQVAKRIEIEGIQAWFDLDPREVLGDEVDYYRKVDDVLDVWFDSGVTHAAVLHDNKELHHPADLYVEGSDQYRGWFQSSLLTSVAMYDRAPYKNVLTHGFTVDAKGEKMSKSKGNVIAPQTVVNSLGADVLRLWIASADYTREMSVSDEILTRTSDMYRRIRNTLRFLLANMHGFDPKQHLVEDKQLLWLDRWAIDRAWQWQQTIIKAYDTYDFAVISQHIHQFCSIDLGAFYLDVIKDRQYTAKTGSLAQRSCQTALYHIAAAMVRWIAPILSFTADEAWSYLMAERESSVFLAQWYQGLYAMKDQALNRNDWDTIITIKQSVNKAIEGLRAQNILGGSLEAEVTLYADDTLHPLLKQLGDELRFLLITSRADLQLLSACPQDAMSTDLAGLKLQIQASTHTKCARCWHRREDVGQHAEHPEICTRCVSNIGEHGEQRCYV